MVRIIPLIYVIIGAVVANEHAYFHLHTFSQVLSAGLAIGLWPLVLLGASLHLHLG